MDIFKDVVNRKTIPTAADPDGRFQYHAERLTAAAITQTYNYMIEGGLEYGLLTTGETIVFLRVDWREPGILLYHLAEPAFEVAAQSGEHYACTAVGQYLAFSLMALGPPGNLPKVRSQDERQRVILGLRRWAEDFETTLRSIPRDERYAPSGSSSGSLRRKKTVQMCSQESETGTTSLRRMSPRVGCRTPRHRLSRGRVVRAKAHGAASAFWTEGRAGKLHKNDSRLNAKCPNVLLHRQAKAAAANHLIDRDEFLRLLFQQLQESLDHGISRLDVGGSRGVLFKVSLMAYGYTFVAKGTDFRGLRCRSAWAR
ncbi:hypothetical protein TruAng_012348 [Truncatella angustata]|nr:hypothetical protein TruAng_012348 [Truncatella angustata]